MRLFIAINFDDTELDAFEAARERLRDQAGRQITPPRESAPDPGLPGRAAACAHGRDKRGHAEGDEERPRL